MCRLTRSAAGRTPRPSAIADASSRARSAGSRSRAPTSTTRSAGTGAKPGTVAHSADQQSPTVIDSAQPSKKPVSVVSGVLKSAWQSSHTRPSPSAPTPATTACWVWQLPVMTTGSAPRPRAPATARATCRLRSKHAPISLPNGALRLSRSTRLGRSASTAPASSASGPAPMPTPSRPST